MTESYENLVLAVLHRTGSGLIFKNGSALASIFNSASKVYPEFEDFSWHPHYHYSKALDCAISMMISAGEIIYRSNDTLVLSEHALGKYGARIFGQFPPESQNKIDIVASEVREAFPSSVVYRIKPLSWEELGDGLMADAFYGHFSVTGQDSGKYLAWTPCMVGDRIAFSSVEVGSLAEGAKLCEQAHEGIMMQSLLPW